MSSAWPNVWPVRASRNVCSTRVMLPCSWAVARTVMLQIPSFGWSGPSIPPDVLATPTHSGSGEIEISKGAVNGGYGVGIGGAVGHEGSAGEGAVGDDEALEPAHAGHASTLTSAYATLTFAIGRVISRVDSVRGQVLLVDLG